MNIRDAQAEPYRVHASATIASVLDSFRGNCSAVEGLLSFDKAVLELSIGWLEDLHERLRKVYASEQQNGGRVLTLVRNIRDNESIRTKYRVIYGQAIVLLVSHFASAMGDLFRAAISISLERAEHGALLDEDVRLTFREMRDRDWNMQSSAADLLIAKKDLTFQDMQSIARAFDTYLQVQLIRDRVTNNIILGQAARHVLVHSGGVATERMLRQLAGAKPRTLKQEIALGEVIAFTPTEVMDLMSEMQSYLARTARAVETQISRYVPDELSN